MLSENQLIRVTADFKKYAGSEEITTSSMGSTVYAFGSELAALRIGNHFSLAMHESKARVEYSENLRTWVFSLQIGN